MAGNDARNKLVGDPIRTCAGCRRRRPQHTLLRVVRDPGGTVSVDAVGPGSSHHPGERAVRAPGRGAYLCPDETCMDRARKRAALHRALRYDGVLPAGLWDELRRRSVTSGPSRTEPRR